jgi:hypothetical protein
MNYTELEEAKTCIIIENIEYVPISIANKVTPAGAFIAPHPL